jgi:hypothetical protein
MRSAPVAFVSTMRDPTADVRRRDGWFGVGTL